MSPAGIAKPSAGTADLAQAFEAWCSHQRQLGRLRRASSEAVYRAMWLALADWCAAQSPRLGLADLGLAALASYVAGRTGLLLADGVLTPRYQARLLALVRRVQAHRLWLRQQARPSAAQAGLAVAMPLASRSSLAATAGASTEIGPPRHLSSADDQRLVRQLCLAPSPPGGRWQAQRDGCAAALQLGAGLGPGEVRALRLADVVCDGGPVPRQPWQLRVAASGSAPAHVAPLAAWAGALLAGWLALRQAQGLDGDWLFPSTRSGKPWGKVAQYEAGRRVLADAGLDPDGGGSFRLRHTFALRQLHRGLDESQLAQWLGVVDPSVMLRYRQALAGWAPALATSADPGDPPAHWLLPA